MGGVMYYGVRFEPFHFTKAKEVRRVGTGLASLAHLASLPHLVFVNYTGLCSDQGRGDPVPGVEKQCLCVRNSAALNSLTLPSIPLENGLFEAEIPGFCEHNLTCQSGSFKACDCNAVEPGWDGPRCDDDFDECYWDNPCAKGLQADEPIPLCQSFTPPQRYSCALRPIPGSLGNLRVPVSDSAGLPVASIGEVVTLRVSGSFELTSIRFGTSQNPDAFECASFSIEKVTERQTVNGEDILCNSVISCTLDRFLGQDLTFTITSCLQTDNTTCDTLTMRAHSDEPIDFINNTSGSFYQGPASAFSAPLPEIYPNTLRLFASNGSSSTATGSNLVLEENTQQTITFDGSGWYYEPSLLKVTYGSFPCSITPDTNLDRIVCVLFPFSVGANMSFIVDAWGQVAVSEDHISFPDGAEIDSVEGCSEPRISEDGVGTANCNTIGGEILTIRGDLFLVESDPQDPVVNILADPCPVLFVNSTMIKCVLPAGTGSLLPLTVTTQPGNLRSIPRKSISYTPPTLSSLSAEACIPGGDPLSLENCTRQGNFTLTIVGDNFGQRGAQVFVGLSQCLHVVHSPDEPDRLLTCQMAPFSGRGFLDALVVLQLQGERSQDNAFLSSSQCEPGSRLDVVQQVCSVCPGGFFSSSFGATSCSECLPGLYTSPGLSSCRPCPVGKFADSAGTESCQPCVIAKFSTGGVTTCSSCPAGKFNEAPAQSTCTSCAVGLAAESSGQNACTECQVGKFSLSGASICQDCRPGTYQGNSAQSSCSLCTPGTYSPESGAALCLACANGTYSGLGNKACTECEAGKANPLEGQDQCVNCASGYSASKVGMYECELCLPGTFSLQGALTCTNCPLGTYQNRSGQRDCLSCDVGFFGNASGFSSCLHCQPGYYSKIKGSQLCVSCRPGSSQNRSTQSSCKACEAGFFANSTGMRQCLSCVPGYFSAQANAIGCTACPKGFSQNSSSSNQCDICPTGFYADSIARPECQACPKGTAGKLGDVTCQPCAKGSFQEQIAQNKCELCPVGKIANTTGSSSCSACAPGYTAQVGSRECKPCQLGLFQSLNTQDECVPCLPGTFTGTEGSANCSACPAGKFALTGWSSCSACDRGYFSGPEPAQSVCEPCSAGRFANATGLSSCLACQLGSASKAGALECVLCEPGSVASEPGSFICSRCPAGTASTQSGQAECDICVPGTFSSSQGSDRCSQCPSGRYQSLSGSSSCVDCVAGFSATREGLALCEPCIAGLSSLRRAVDCFSCPTGKYTNVSGLSSCMTCEIGKYQPKASQTRCGLCEGGYVPLPDRSDCSLCQVNTVSSPGSDECVPCKLGMVSSDRKNCLCPEGQYGVGSGSEVVCRGCPTGGICAFGVEYTDIISAENYYRPTNTSEFYLCPQKRCVGGTNAPLCVASREGPLCGLCIEGYEEQSGVCAKCPSDGVCIGVAVGIVAVSVCVLLVMYFVLVRAGLPSKDEAAKARALKQYCILEQVPDPSNELNDLGYEGVTSSLKIIIGFFQLSSAFARNVSIPIPKLFTQFLSYFDVFSASAANAVPWFSIRCLNPGVDFYTEYIVTGLVPMGLIPIFLSVYYIRGWVESRDMSDDREREFNAKHRNATVIMLALFTAFLMYPTLAATILEYFMCRNIEGTWYMLMHVETLCFNEAWFQYLPVAVFYTLLYPVGTPLVMLLLVRNHRTRLRDPFVKQAYGVLYDYYQIESCYHETFDMLYKLTMTSVGGFVVNTNLGLIAASIGCLIYTWKVLLFPPYLRNRDDRLQLLVNVEIIIQLFLSQIILLEMTEVDGQGYPPAVDIVLSILLLLLTCGVVVLFLFMNCKGIWWLCKYRDYRKQILEEIAQQDAEEEKKHNRHRSFWDLQAQLQRNASKGKIFEVSVTETEETGTEQIAVRPSNLRHSPKTPYRASNLRSSSASRNTSMAGQKFKKHLYVSNRNTRASVVLSGFGSHLSQSQRDSLGELLLSIILLSFVLFFL